MAGSPLPVCRIDFLSRWTAENHLWGVVLGSGGLQIERKAFSCCGGDGVIIESLSDKNARLCGLSRRWSLLDAVLRQAVIPAENAQEFLSFILLRDVRSEKSVCEHEMSALMAENLNDWLTADKGRCFSSSSPGLGASAIKSRVVPIVAAALSYHRLPIERKAEA